MTATLRRLTPLLIFSLSVLAAPAIANADTPPTIVLSATSTTYGHPVTATGATDAAAALPVAIEWLDGSTWTQVASAATDASGAFTATFDAATSGSYRARRTDTGTAGTANAYMEVMPTLSSSTRKTAVPWIGARLTLRFAPASYAGKVTVTVSRKGRTVGTVRGTAKAGKVTLTLPTPGVGTFADSIHVGAFGDLAASNVTSSHTAHGKNLHEGSTGPYVRGLSLRLQQLNFHTPATSSTYDYRLGDSVIAFHKAMRLDRTDSISVSDFTRLTNAAPMKAHFKTGGTHIEVDKTRQILTVVKGGKVIGVFMVSTGATGNTPVGTFHILRKAPASGTWLGPGILFRAMTFYRGFAIHGYSPVPVWPASHGCVREPNWIADWTYRNSSIGEPVHVYNS